MQNKTKNNTKKILFFLIIILANSFCYAELQNLNSSNEQKVSKNNITALFGVSGGNSMITDDGTIFASLRIGVQFNNLVALGANASSIVSDVRNYNVKEKQLINYKTFGLFFELFPIRFNNFAISVPIDLSVGIINALENGEDSFEAEDYVFTSAMSLHFNYRITKMLEVSIGGGYRMFAFVEENNLDNLDFCTPFGEIRFTIKE